MTPDERPILRALVSFPTRAEPEYWTAAPVVSLEVAVELQAKGYMVLVDPQDERDLAMYERLVRSVEKQRKTKWYEVP